MKFKSILLTAAATFSLATATMAQVPNYVPTNGLVAWWPFNGNANDESGNGYNGSVNGATLTNDRFGNADAAYSFDGINDYIDLGDMSGALDNITQFTLAYWINSSMLFNTFQGYNQGGVFSHWIYNGQPTSAIGFQTSLNSQGQIVTSVIGGQGANSISQVTSNENTHVAITYDGAAVPNQRFSLFINGIFSEFINFSSSTGQFGNLGNKTVIGGYIAPAVPNFVYFYFLGTLDDIGIWNRALVPQELNALSNAIDCTNSTSIIPQSNSFTIGSTASFISTTSDTNPSYVWQSNFGQGFQTLNNFGNYSGVNTANLNIANIQLSEHNQPIRVITTSGNCVDTSNVAVINILDTCITNLTVYDTLLTTVTDTLVINTLITGIIPQNNLNTLKVFPNPASTHITIDYGNFNIMSGYTLTIVNSIGQTVFTTPINQQTSYIDLSSWTGNGIYFVQLIDPQNNTIENRKIVIQ